MVCILEVTYYMSFPSKLSSKDSNQVHATFIQYRKVVRSPSTVFYKRVAIYSYGIFMNKSHGSIHLSRDYIYTLEATSKYKFIQTNSIKHQNICGRFKHTWCQSTGPHNMVTLPKYVMFSDTHIHHGSLAAWAPSCLIMNRSAKVS